MIINLFDIFDPSNSTIGIAWIFLIAPIIIIANKTRIKNNSSFSNNLIVKTLQKETLAATNGLKTNTIVPHGSALFAALAVMNLAALVPSSFAPSAQIAQNFPLALIIWITVTTFSAINNTNNSLAHLVPAGSPVGLIPIIVLIELSSNIIRPITLSVRLTANIVAGHVLILLAENFTCSGSSPIVGSMVIMSTLTILEASVAIIQAYVITILISLYSTENH